MGALTPLPRTPSCPPAPLLAERPYKKLVSPATANGSHKPDRSVIVTRQLPALPGRLHRSPAAGRPPLGPHQCSRACQSIRGLQELGRALLMPGHPALSPGLLAGRGVELSGVSSRGSQPASVAGCPQDGGGSLGHSTSGTTPWSSPWS